MGDKTGIEWTEATTTVDRGGRRTRTYIRKKPGVPGRRRRTEMAAIGMKWCRSCEAWLPTCVRCNSSKKAMQLADWLDLGAPITEYMAEYMIGINQGI